MRNIQVEQLCVLQSAYEAIEDAGITLNELHNTTTGIFVAGYTTFLVSGVDVFIAHMYVGVGSKPCPTT